MMRHSFLFSLFIVSLLMSGAEARAQSNVSGNNVPTVTAVTTITNPVNSAQSGTWTVQPGNTANSTPWLVTDSATVSQATAIGSVKNILAGANALAPGTGASYTAAQINPLTQGTDGSLRMMMMAPSFTNIAASSTGTAVKATAGVLKRVIIGTGVASATIRVLNLASAGCTASPTSPTVALFTLPSTVGNPVSIDFDVAMSAGICVVASGATNVTVIYY